MRKFFNLVLCQRNVKRKLRRKFNKFDLMNLFHFYANKKVLIRKAD